MAHASSPGGGGAPGEAEVQLWQTKKEQAQFQDLADLYSIIVAVEKLEKAYVRDAVSPKDYEEACQNLISKFKTLQAALRDNGVPSVEAFMAEYKMDCPQAAIRLLQSGFPATVEHMNLRDDGEGMAAVNDVTESFINALDAFQLNVRDVGELDHLLQFILSSLHSVPQTKLPADFEGKAKVKEWQRRLGALPAYAKLDEDQATQLKFDLERAYNDFKHLIRHRRPPGGGGGGP